MSKRPLSAIIKDWHKKSSRENRRTPAQVRKLVKQDPDGLEARLHTNPYGNALKNQTILISDDVYPTISATMLASPLRKCSFHSRILPSSTVSMLPMFDVDQLTHHV